MSSLLNAFLALGVAAALTALAREKKEHASAFRRVFEFLAAALFAAQCLSWLAAGAETPPFALPPELSWGEIITRGGAALVLGVLATRGLRRAPGRGWARRGLEAGLLSALLGFHAYRWLCVAAAWRAIGGFAGIFIGTLLPVLLAGALTASILALCLESLRPFAPRLLAALLLLWAGGVDLAVQRLRRSWDFGPATLAEAAGLPGDGEPVRFARVWLRPAGGKESRLETVKLEAEGLEASGEALDRLKLYIVGRGLKSVFKNQAVTALRKGWRLWWDADRALMADMIGAPGLVAPDYRGALMLLRAGPITAERYAKLEDLALLAKSGGGGFEDVTQSQYIFEGFSAAYARFGDEEHARSWLLRIDGLWPIYEKRIEASGLESFRSGRIAGLVTVDGAAARGVLVGLFLIPVSTGAARGADSVLSASAFPDDRGRFEFTDLGSGRYFLALMGPAGVLGSAAPSPGVLTLDEEHPDVLLPPIVVSRPLPPPGEGLGPPQPRSLAPGRRPLRPLNFP